MTLIWRTYRRLIPLLPGRAQRFLWVYVVASCAFSLLDVVALALLALSVTAMVQNNPVNLPVIGEISPSGYIGIIGAISGLIIAKSFLALALQWVATRRFSAFELEIGDKLFDAYIKAPWTERLRRNTSQLVRMADVGIANVTAGFLLPIIGLPSLMVTSFAVILVLLVAQPLTAVVSIAYLGLISVLLYFVLARRTVQAGRVNRDYSFKVAALMTDMVAALKEITLRNKASEVATVVHDNRIHTTRARANISFLSAVPKFVLDSALIGGFVLVGGLAYLTGGAASAVSAVAMFAVAGMRLVPSLTGFQSVVSTTTANIPQVEAVISDILDAQEYLEKVERIGHEKLTHTPRVIRLEQVAFTYPGRHEPAVHHLNLTIPMGTTVGLAGSSGAGKTTLVDILLGLLVPQTGDLRVDDQRLEDVLADWRSRVGYVPQDVSLFDATIAQNVALTWGGAIDMERVEESLRRAQLWETVEDREGGMLARVGDRGMAFSGGQRQRLGIARALYSDPLVLVMDEATSALDTKTESDVAAAIRSLRGEVTVISVAHRLSTIRDADLVCFMRGGTIVSQGSFAEVVAAEPEFAQQAALAGLI